MAVVAALELEDFLAAGVSRASRIALMAASVPELTIRTSSMEGKAPVIRAAISTSATVGAP